MSKTDKRIIIFDNKIYELTEKQFEKLIEVNRESKDLPFGGLHLEEHLNFSIKEYKFVAEIDANFDEELGEYM
ncbi:hypothetical protein [uncultured Chryseobacterium sp.]|uniref:hypothetical protein n=1 Tax=uncultured Chryseobacterium sp. TaxID=259322 RepID=UPI0025EFAF6B|nr:hypothetical protein [uncultured Chryseobacterium sp.]